jgi:hypothetical protein
VVVDNSGIANFLRRVGSWDLHHPAVASYDTRNVVDIRIIVLEAVDRLYCIDPDDDLSKF